MFDLSSTLPQTVEPGDARVAEYRGRAYTLDESQGVRLTHKRAGYYPAGSVARFERESWGYEIAQGGAKFGRRFDCERAARDAFRAIVKARGGA